MILPLGQWRERQTPEVLAGQATSRDALLLQADDVPEALQPWLDSLPLIAIDVAVRQAMAAILSA